MSQKDFCFTRKIFCYISVTHKATVRMAAANNI